LKHIKAARPDVLFLQFDDPDDAGHSAGFHPGDPDYLGTLRRIDGYVGRLVETTQARSASHDEEWLIILLSDHGGTEGRSHGGQSIEERRVPFMVSGQGVALGEIDEQVYHVDTCATAMAFLGVPIKPEWDLDGKARGLVN